MHNLELAAAVPATVAANNGADPRGRCLFQPPLRLAVTDEFGNTITDSNVLRQLLVLATVREAALDADGAAGVAAAALTDEVFVDVPFLFSNDAVRVSQVQRVAVRAEAIQI